MKKLPVVAGALVVAQLLSGCYVLRESNWTKDKVEIGKSTTFEAKLVGTSANSTRFFILPRLAGDVSIRRPVFDTKEKVGSRKKLVEDAVLGQVAVDTGVGCDASVVPPRRGPSVPSRAYKTPNPVPSANNKFVISSFKAKLDPSQTSGVAGVVYVGYWDDDGDGIPEGNNDDVINCSGFTTAAFLVK
jgi:hypothetical protein